MSGETKAPGGLGATTLSALLALFSLFHIYTALHGAFEPLIQRGLFIGVALLCCYAVFYAQAASRLSRAMLFALGAVGFFGGLFAIVSNARFMDIMADLTVYDQAVAAGLILATLEAARRSIGLAMPCLAALSLVYYLYGNDLLSGGAQPPAVSAQTAAMTLYASTTGIFGFMADIGTRVIAVFIIFGSLVMSTGAGKVFMDTAVLLAGRRQGGAAKVSVITSTLFGTVSGSAVANVMAMGSVTIPTMTRAGYRRPFAAGIEATASTGGQIMPPIMGAGAFIMAELLNIDYGRVALAALLPAALFFGAIFLSVDFYARRQGLQAEDPDRRTARELLNPLTFLPMLLPLLALIVFLVLGRTPALAGVYAILALVGTLVATRVAERVLAGRPGEAPGALLQLLRDILAGLVDGGRNLAMIAVLLACSGLLVSVLTSTGLGTKLSSLILSFGSDQLLLTLVASAILCILLGMDVPTTASYVLAASVAAPALTALGLPRLSAHMFVFYFAVLAAITPPVCASVYAAASIAGENFWKVAAQALRIGGAVFFIPFTFVYRPGLLFIGGYEETIYAFAVAAVAVGAFCGGSIGYWFGRANWAQRIALLLTAAMLATPSFWADLAGLLAAAAITAWAFLLRISASRKEGPPAVAGQAPSANFNKEGHGANAEK